MVKPNEGPATRLAGEYNGSGVDFYWSYGDRLLLNAPTERPKCEWQADKKNNLYGLANPLSSSSSGRAPRATFWFEGEFTKPEYRVRYLGKGNGGNNPDEIFIPEELNYIGPFTPGLEDARQGDFATGIARRQPDGNYTFTLEHKGSYITFRPYSEQTAFTKWGGAYVEQIDVSADQALCGSFKIKGDTIDLSSRPVEGYKKSSCNLILYNLLRLTVGNPPAVPPVLGHPHETPSYAIMSIAPGTYTNFTVRYWIPTRAPGGYGYVTKTYPRVTFTAGKNKVISQNINTSTEYPADKYYMWDAAEHYWKGYEWDGPNPEQPDYDEPGKSDKNPKDKNDPRWCSEVAPYADPTGAAPAVAATRSCKDCPNINELLWYIQQGLIWADSPELFSVMNSRYAGRYRIRKLSAIAKSVGKTVEELKAKAPDGVDYTRSTKMPNHFMMSNALASGLSEGTTKDDYFLLPVMGAYGPSKREDYKSPSCIFELGRKAYYWSSTPIPGHPDLAYCLVMAEESGNHYNAEVTMIDRRYGLSVMWPTDR
ncbi:MAG: hypothetical protein ACFNO3_05445 [Alloprevotella tannerae]